MEPNELLSKFLEKMLNVVTRDFERKRKHKAFRNKTFQDFSYILSPSSHDPAFLYGYAKRDGKSKEAVEKIRMYVKKYYGKEGIFSDL